MNFLKKVLKDFNKDEFPKEKIRFSPKFVDRSPIFQAFRYCLSNFDLAVNSWCYCQLFLPVFKSLNKRECAYTDALILSILCNRFELKDMKGSPKMNVVSLALSRDSTLLMRRDSPKVILLKSVQ